MKLGAQFILRYFKLLTLVLVLFVSGCDSDTIRFSSDVLTKKYSTKLIGHLSKPEGEGPFPTVVLMHGCAGLSIFAKMSLNSHARFLNDHGFATVILDSFSSRDKNGGDICSSNDELGAARYYRTFDAFNALVYLNQQSYVDHDNIFLVGQSNGGSVAVMVAGGGTSFNYSDDLKYTAVVAYYPWCGMYIDYLVSPLLVLSGAKDDWTPPDGCMNQRNTVEGEDLEVVVYPEAHHGFDLPISQKQFAGHTVGGHSPSTKDSRKRMLNFFKERMAP
jgi:dienelactone hydrolase